MHVAHPLIVELAKLPVTCRNILDDHVRDEHGRCAGCGLDPRLRQKWPCALRRLAVQAQQHDREVRAGLVSSAA